MSAIDETVKFLIQVIMWVFLENDIQNLTSESEFSSAILFSISSRTSFIRSRTYNIYVDILSSGNNVKDQKMVYL